MSNCSSFDRLKGKPSSTFTPLGFSFGGCNPVSSQLSSLRRRKNGPHPYSVDTENNPSPSPGPSPILLTPVFQPDFEFSPFPNLWSPNQVGTATGEINRILDDEGNYGIESVDGFLRYPNLSTFAFGWDDPFTVEFRTKFDRSYTILSNLQFDGSNIWGILVEVGYGGKCAINISAGSSGLFFAMTQDPIGDSEWHSVRVVFDIEDFVPDTPAGDYSDALRIWIDRVEVPFDVFPTGTVGSADSCVSSSDILIGESIQGVPTGICVSDLKVYSKALPLD